MPSLTRLVTFCCAVAVANASWFKSSDDVPSWTPAKETFGSAQIDPLGWTPRPTVAPGADLVEMELRKRSGTSTCGYFAGYSSSAAVVCINSASCVLNSGNSVMGCCNSANITNCQIATACLDSTQASLATGANLAYTIVCSSASYPHCVTYSYDSYDPLFPGYSALGCGVENAVYSVEYYAPVLGSASTAGATRVSSSTRLLTTSSPFTSAASSTSSDSTSSLSVASSSTRGLSSGGDSTSTAVSQPAATPVGAIVGGVVGGIGGLALLAAGIFLIVRHSRKKNEGGAPPAAGPGQVYPPGPGPDQSQYGQNYPQMGQPTQQYAAYPPAGFAAVDNRASMAPSSTFSHSPKPGYDYSSVSVSPQPQSPDQIYHNQGAGYGPPPNAQQPQYPPYHPPPTQQYQAYDPQQHGRAMELPTAASDRELRELA